MNTRATYIICAARRIRASATIICRSVRIGMRPEGETLSFKGCTRLASAPRPLLRIERGFQAVYRSWPGSIEETVRPV